MQRTVMKRIGKALVVLVAVLVLALGVYSAYALQEIDTSVVSTAAHRPAHHGDGEFINPYMNDAKRPGIMDFFTMYFFDEKQYPNRPRNYRKFWHKADVEALAAPNKRQPQATFIGHSTVLVQYKGLNVLTDPIFSRRASLVQFAGPQRYTPTAVTIAELPRIDVVVISHSHFDHLDEGSVKALGNTPQWIVPLGLKKWFANHGIDNVIELDWWHSHRVVVGHTVMDVQALPSQHWSKRSLYDKNKSLWASWAFQWDDFTAWFGGDTSYNDVQFKQIGDALGTVDLAMIPIGAYEPRWFMKTSHVNPEEAVKIFEDINAVHAFGIHWNTFVLTAEPLNEPPQKLAVSMRAHGIAPHRFIAMPIGDTWRGSTRDAPPVSSDKGDARP